jgi:hypothetical protein
MKKVLHLIVYKVNIKKLKLEIQIKAGPKSYKDFSKILKDKFNMDLAKYKEFELKFI